MAATKKLLIVESPAKAKTIKKILGKDFTVKASVGHIRDLKSSGRGKKALGIDIEHGYKPDYTIIKGKEKTVKELQDAAAKADEVYLAPDPDREGEAIAWHLKEALSLSDEEAHRVTYSAITKSAVLKALENPHKIDMDRVNAQQGRRVLDRLVGFSLSPFLWKKVAKNLSAGRVQSVALRIVVEREREIKAFVPEEYWKIKALVSPPEAKKDQFEAALVRWQGKKFELGNPAAATEASSAEVADHIKANSLNILKIETREAKGRPSPPYITSTLQQGASTFLGFGTTKTMSVAQKLYEGMEIDGETQGLITYMRTDSTRIAPEALDDVRNYIKNNFDPEFLPEKPQIYSTKSKNAQDAHEAIRPSSTELTPEKVKPYLTRDQYRLYELIWRRFVASQMPPARFDITTVTIAAGEAELEAKGRIVRFPGHTILIPDSDKKEDSKYQNLPDVKENDPLDMDKLDVTQNFTKPPSRYSEASLVKALEKEGIGRPSTYAPIIKTINDRGYVRLEKRAFHATELGMAVVDILISNFDDIMDLQFTANMEGSLDEVEQGKTDWVKLIDQFYKPFDARLEKALKDAEPLKGRPWEGEEKCPLCGGNLVVRYSVNGAFLGCANYPECKGLMPMPGENEGEDANGEPAEAVACPECGSNMVLKKSRYGKEFLACSRYPECKTTMSVDKDGKPVELPKIERDCDVCGKPMEVKMGRRGPFLACSGYPDCKNTMPIDKDGNVIVLPKVEGEVCEKCGKPMEVKMGRRGPFLACTGFPKCRNAKPLPGEEGADKKKTDNKDDGEKKK
ncbi:MAG: type I DNA topoisomerase [Spirochaetales bacterium]|nr:type I DNA topoisomerase [Spirochaetales bacterium]